MDGLLHHPHTRYDKLFPYLWAFVALLAAAGGFLDAYTYLLRGGVFANAQTGNIVLLSQNLFTGNWSKVPHYLVPLVFFALFISAAEGMRYRFQQGTRIHWRQLILLEEIVTLFAVGLMPASLNMLANATVSFSCAMQVQAFRKVNGYAFASTMCIGNLRSGMDSLCAYLRTRNRDPLRKAVHYFAIILLFALGAGLGGLAVTVGENLSYPDERVVCGTAGSFSHRKFDSLSVLLAEAAEPSAVRRTPGFADEAFLRGNVPMTKQEVRAAALAKLAIRPGDTVWDVGAGTGSVCVEMALAARRGRVYAVERQPEACGLIRQNRERFGAWNLTVVPGRAPEALAGLPAPDRVFVGGTGGHMAETLAAVHAANPAARVVISAIAIESLSAALAALQAQGFEAIQVSQISVSRSRPAGGLHLMMAQNPVYLISGGAL